MISSLIATGITLSASLRLSQQPLRLSLILRRLDETERKLDHVLQELRTPAAIGYSVRRGSLPRKD
jgi:hypothetical protein